VIFIFRNSALFVSSSPKMHIRYYEFLANVHFVRVNDPLQQQIHVHSVMLRYQKPVFPDIEYCTYVKYFLYSSPIFGPGSASIDAHYQVLSSNENVIHGIV